MAFLPVLYPIFGSGPKEENWKIVAGVEKNRQQDSSWSDHHIIVKEVDNKKIDLPTNVA